MGWTSWFFGGSSDSDGDGVKFKSGQDGKDGSFKSERLSGNDQVHYHDIAKTSTEGEYKEVYPSRSDYRGK